MPTASEIRVVAKEVDRIFTLNGLSCCLVGGGGCVLYGCTRTPSDVDIVVMTQSHTQESLKEMLVHHDHHFYTRASKQIGATWRVLFYTLPETLYSRHRKRWCKVDILTPGTMNIPHIDPPLIKRISGLPVMPLLPLLLLKLQAWDDHRTSLRADFRQKQYVDVSDVKKLVGVARVRGEHIRDAQTELGLPGSFVEAGKVRVRVFVSLMGVEDGCAEDWAAIGLFGEVSTGRDESATRLSLRLRATRRLGERGESDELMYRFRSMRL
ncbi:hypothetical protein K474DRAFT_1599451 [Panus rudis PR-1116 ss-1]|nr:hypothetical protein K474DRAFT_1599451 [Panus rudis PR-1116 ss-1]